MTQYNIDPKLLEQGEKVLWAAGDLAPKKPWKYASLVAALAAILFAAIQTFSWMQSWSTFKEIWASQGLWWTVGLTILFMIVVILSLRWMDKRGIAPDKQSEYYVGMITNQRLVLFSANRGDDVTIYPGEVKSAHFDYSNGARALRLDLHPQADKPSVTMTSTADIAEAKRVVDEYFFGETAQ